MNLIEAPVEGTVAVLGDLRIPLPTGASERERVVVGVRPESWDLVGRVAKGLAGRGCRPARRVGSRIVRVRERLTDCQWQSRSGRIVIRVDRKMSVAPGEPLHLLPKAGEVYFFSAETGVRL